MSAHRGTTPLRRSASARLAARAVLGVCVTLGALTGCGAREGTGHLWVAGGNPARGEQAIRRYGCGACHRIPGIAAARGTVGPTLDAMPQRTYIGGVAINSPENLVRWIENPQSVDPVTAMPNLGVAPQDARDIASYLYTLD